MKKITSVLVVGLGALAIASAPGALADGTKDLTNADVAASADGSPSFVPYRVTVPEPSTGGQGAFDFWADHDGDGDKEFSFDDGLSGSSREVLNHIRAAKRAAKQAAEGDLP